MSSTNSTREHDEENITIHRLPRYIQELLDENLPTTQIAQDFGVCTKTIYSFQPIGEQLTRRSHMETSHGLICIHNEQK